MFRIENRRYVGNKFKLIDWIRANILEYCENSHSFFDVFAGTGVVARYMLNDFNSIYINDFLFSNEMIFQGFFSEGKFSLEKLIKIKNEYNAINSCNLTDNYVSNNYGDKFFAYNDAKKIGYIREDIEQKYNSKRINKKEYSILLSSLLYSFDRIANTVGHYEAYIKGKEIRSGALVFDLIEPADIENKTISIFREDSNNLVKAVRADIAFIDPPYNSRQYSRFYHVLETIIKWDNPKLYGVAMKPKEENMSDYCRSTAPKAFDELIQNLNVKYIVVTYNNTYNSKSSSSQNKITLEEIETSLQTRGQTRVLERPYKFFNAGKTDFSDHKEYLFITKVEK